MRSSSPLPPHFSANSLGRCVWPQPCSKVVDGQVRGVVCDAAAQADIQVQDLVFLPSVSETADGGITQLMERNIGEESSQVLLWLRHPPLSTDAETAGCVMKRSIERNTTISKDEASKQIDTKDGLENCCDQLVDDCGDARATSWWQRAPRIGLLPAPNSIMNPECKSAPQSSKDSTFLDVNMWECCAGCQSHGEGVFSSAGFFLVLDVTAFVTGF